jgi:hypothetical protein
VGAERTRRTNNNGDFGVVRPKLAVNRDDLSHNFGTDRRNCIIRGDSEDLDIGQSQGIKQGEGVIEIGPQIRIDDEFARGWGNWGKDW